MQGAAKQKAKYGMRSQRERDEDLLLFREIFKREKEKNAVSLLEPVSTEFESSKGSFSLYKLPPGKKGAGNDILSLDKEKSDFDWLKTPPATPLFPSLEMEARDPNMIFQRELPILQPIRPSRFSAKMEEAKLEQTTKSPSSRSATSTKSCSSSHSETSCSRPTSSSKSITSRHRTVNPKEGLKISTKTSENRKTSTSGKQNLERKPQSRGVSPMARARTPAKMPGFFDATPPDFKTSHSVIQARAASATRGQPVARATSATRVRQAITKMPLPAVEQKVKVARSVGRESCSPSVTRGRKTEFGEHNFSGNKAKVGDGMGNGIMVIGSKMVEKMMNARLTAGWEEMDSKRLMPRTSLDIAQKRGEINKNPAGLKSSANTGPNTRLSTQAAPSSDARTSGETKFSINQTRGNRTKKW